MMKKRGMKQSNTYGLLARKKQDRAARRRKARVKTGFTVVYIAKQKQNKLKQPKGCFFCAVARLISYFILWY